MLVTIQTIGIVLQMILSIAGNLSNNQQINNIITLLEQWLPTLVKEATDLVPLVQQIIDTLRGNATLTADQITAIDNLNTQTDADFDAAAAAAMGSN